jgi:uncharacterized protein (TIGR02246 family)
MPARNPSEVHAVFVDAFNRGDVEALVALYEPNAVLVVSGQPVIGHEAIRQAYQRMLARQGLMELTTRSVLESGDGLAVLHGQWSLHFPAADGAMTSAEGLSTEVVRRQPDGTWLFVLDEPRTPE